MEVVKAGSCVLLDINNGEHFVFSRLTPAATVKLGKAKYSLAPVIGCPFGSQFEPKSSSLERSSRAEDNNAGEEEEEEEENAATKDNRNLIDDNTAQTLSAEEIHSMKREGSSGQEIVNALIANSASFESKTTFSQEKYKRKKQKKYAPRVIIRCPTAKSVCEAYFSKTPAKIGFIRVDSLSMILSLANVGEMSNVLVSDMVGGLLTAAVAERLSGFGTVCSVYYTPKAPSLDIVGLFNFDSATSSRIFRVRLSTLLESYNSGLQNGEPAPLVVEQEKNMEDDSGTGKPLQSNPSMDVQPEKAVTEASQTSVSQISENLEPVSTNPTKQRLIQQPSNEDVSDWVKTGFSSLIVGALNADPLKTLQQLLPLLAPSAPFVIYHTYLQPLADCMFALQKERTAVSLQLSEPWMREYQVLPSRTHPHMQMSSTGGYILSGIKTLPQ
ncbi:tRNA (adenine(58)-N(1))-methyltransferase non-catalytic subunit trm6 isoform X2 [Selaginella moellendorffii]|uniref:tRNA (adenine(58)-N(1))-methyltransferase non-catalytic subunit trm6 isoform X2 n=1 Tax=Selaginella moellendorffii TaxID=88036 RepID=UPI000D1C5119|nr:tRNA (adenine(58)-N(1))-methyltransferase non-catalytic subunit trm6 isoform X2 [Selaginella moellendorffii]|eukprot:XP_024530152.1 tRNA (adenine(58)-N(1))-methyltransferase non-catalytic subunit trm6 isoform X2 [Selaginella moellendorffii]